MTRPAAAIALLALALVHSDVLRCARCKTFYCRLPRWDNGSTGGKGDDCDRCGCTSFSISPGRSWGPRSRQWKMLVLEYESYKDMVPEMMADAVVLR